MYSVTLFPYFGKIDKGVKLKECRDLAWTLPIWILYNSGVGTWQSALGSPVVLFYSLRSNMYTTFISATGSFITIISKNSMIRYSFLSSFDRSRKGTCGPAKGRGPGWVRYSILDSGCRVCQKGWGGPWTWGFLKTPWLRCLVEGVFFF